MKKLLLWLWARICSHAAQPKGLRNNNPLNIRFNPAIKWQGQIGACKHGFVIFKCSDMGLRAAGRILRTCKYTHQSVTIAAIVSRWAPETENDTQNYIRVVEKLSGIKAHKTLRESDYPRVVAAMITMENGTQPFSLKRIEKAVALGFKRER
jgi:hypothetical protein